MNFREVGKCLRETWAGCIVILFVIAEWTGVFKNTWVDQVSDWLALLLVGWLVLFAIGVSRGEPNP